MKMMYIAKIQANLKRKQTVHTNRATSRVLEGGYKSIHKGRSMNFDELREYIPGDDIKDIDWKATARSQKVLVRQYIADRKHNVMIVFDTNKRMLGDSDGYEEKRELAIMSAGTLAYFVSKNGDYVAASFLTESGVKYYPFKTGLSNVELILENYHGSVNDNNDTDINETLRYIVRNFRQKMIVLIVTDMHGIKNIPDATLKQLLVAHDVLFLNISDAVPGKKGSKNSYSLLDKKSIPGFISNNPRIKKIIKDKNLSMIAEEEERLKKYGIPCSTIDYVGELDREIINLLEKRKIGN